MAAVIDASWLVKLFDSLARGDDSSFSHLLATFGDPVVLKQSKTKVRTHFLALDVNGAPALSKLAKAMAGFVIDFAIPRKKMANAVKSYVETGSSGQVATLAQEAKDLFVRSEESGEGGELLLFMLMEKSLGYPQLLSKMALKTNPNVHVHGSDGVHGRLGDDGVLDLYWGESKLYKSSSDAIRDCFKSIAPFLDPSDDSARNQDLLLLREHLDVQDQELAAHLIHYFEDDAPESIQVRWNGVCLVGFDLEPYPDAGTAVAGEIQKIQDRVEAWHDSMLTRVTGHNLLSVNVDVFCIPLPSVSALRKAVNGRLGIT